MQDILYQIADHRDPPAQTIMWDPDPARRQGTRACSRQRAKISFSQEERRVDEDCCMEKMAGHDAL